MKAADAMLKGPARWQTVVRPSRWPAWFVLSAGGILALAGANDVLDLFGELQVWDLSDPLLGVPFRYLLPLAGVAELLVAWLCLFTRKRNLGLGLMFWLTLNFVVYRAVLWTMDWHHPWIFVGGMTKALNISPVLADGVLMTGVVYLLAGSALLSLLPRKKPSASPEAAGHFKVNCPSCGGKTAFDAQWLGRSIPCPHCGSPLPLNKPA